MAKAKTAKAKKDHKFVLVEADYWVGLYVDGKCVEQHHDIDLADFLRKYGVDINALENVGIPALKLALMSKSVIVIDEVGAMEMMSAARMKRRMPSRILDGELLARLECVNRFVFGPVILEKPLDVFQLRQRREKAQEKQNSNRPVNQVKDDEILGGRPAVF